MSAPERIEIHIAGYEQNAQYDPYWHMPSREDYAVEYIRTDLAATQPDPRDEVIAALVGALTLARNRLQVCALDHPMNTLPQIERSEWGREATAAIAAAKAVVK